MTELAKDAPIFVAGHSGLVGSAIVRRLEAEGFTNLIVARRDQLDLRDQAAVNYWFRAHRPEYVFLAAGTVGGIVANATRPAEFLYDNMMIHATVVEAAREFDVRKLLYLGSSCIYPRLADQPISEDALLTGPLEPTNEAYAVAKIAGIKLCDAYRAQYGCNFVSAMPTNLYGPDDNFDLTSSHVLPGPDAQVPRRQGGRRRRPSRCGAAARPGASSSTSTTWPTPACSSCATTTHPGPINVGTGKDLTIRELAEMIARGGAPRGRAGVRPDQARRRRPARCST